MTADCAGCRADGYTGFCTNPTPTFLHSEMSYADIRSRIRTEPVRGMTEEAASYATSLFLAVTQSLERRRYRATLAVSRGQYGVKVERRVRGDRWDWVAVCWSLEELQRFSFEHLGIVVPNSI